MRKPVLLILIIFCSANLLLAQSGWQIQTTAFGGKIKSISMLVNGTGYALSDSGKLHKTTNFGVNWIKNFVDFGAVFQKRNCMKALSPDTLFVMEDYYGRIYKSTNGGLNWNIVASGVTGTQTNLYSISFFGKTKGVVCGSEFTPPPPPPPQLLGTERDIVYITTNGGNNWNKVSTGLSNVFYSCFLVDSLTCYFAGLDYWYNTIGRAYRTSNFCNSFSNLINPSPLKATFFVNVNTGWMAGNNGILIKTSNGGINWVYQNVKTNKTINTVFFLDSQTGWIAGDSGTIRKTTDGGLNWNIQGCPVTSALYSIQFLDNSRGWISADNGTILYTSDAGGVTNINPVSISMPDDFKLSHNYPNPFNPVTKIDYGLPEDVNVTIKIFDVSGKEIETLVNENQKKGYYSLEFNAYRLPSGVYFFMIAAGNITAVNKMLLIK